MTRAYPHPHRRRLAVLGSPIDHSKSPALHRAAYEVLDLDWTYEAIEVTGDQLPAFLASRDDTWRGLSLTMPLKRDVLATPLTRVDTVVRSTGSANTLGIGSGEVHAANTDVVGIVEALRPVVDPPSRRPIGAVDILGAGATAASAVVAVGELGARAVHVMARSPEKARYLIDLAVGQGLAATSGTLDDAAARHPDVVISTLPGGTPVAASFSAAAMRHATLLDVAYDPWPSVLATRWQHAGGRVVHGLEMLVEQAIGQIRIFLADDADRRLPEEARVRAAMRDAAGLPTA